jgi:hypothetical protein
MVAPVETAARTRGAEIPIERAHGALANGDVATRTGFRLSWGAIVAGLVIATALQFVFSTLGAAVGLAAFDPNSSAKAFGVGTALWAVLSLLASLFVGGMTAGRLAGVLSRRDGFLHGALLWSLSTLLTVWMLSRGVGAVAGGTFRALGNVVGATAGAVAQGAATAVGGAASAAAGAVAGGDGDVNLRRELTQILSQTGDPALRPESLRADARTAQATATRGPADNEAAVNDIEALVRDRARNVDRNDVVNIIAARTGRSRAEAEQLADRATQAATDARSRLSATAQQVTQTVRTQGPQVAEDVASGASTGLWFALLGMGLGLAAAVLGTQRTARE